MNRGSHTEDADVALKDINAIFVGLGHERRNGPTAVARFRIAVPLSIVQ